VKTVKNAKPNCARAITLAWPHSVVGVHNLLSLPSSPSTESTFYFPFCYHLSSRRHGTATRTLPCWSLNSEKDYHKDFYSKRITFWPSSVPRLFAATNPMKKRPSWVLNNLHNQLRKFPPFMKTDSSLLLHKSPPLVPIFVK